MPTFPLVIGGRLVETASTLGVINPATEEVFATCSRASREELEQAVAAAKRAFPTWSATPIEVRRQALLAMADRIEAHSEELSELLTAEQGRPLLQARGEIASAVKFFRHFGACALEPLKVEDNQQRRLEIRRRPLGVVAAIVPWNYPITLMSFKAPAALVSGNTLVVKPAATTPLTTLRFAALVQDLLPPGVLNVIADANDLGAELTAHPDVRKISFTGSTETGKRVMAGAAAGLKRISLELGGNDALIVLDDVEAEEVAPKVFAAAMHNAGQICIGAKRIYAHERIYDRLCNALAKLADAVVVGDGMKAGVQMGPLQNKAQFEKVLDYIDTARLEGRVIAGGGPCGERGYFVRPTIVRDITDGARLVDEEQFGPVLPVIAYSDPADAVRRANASPYGLGASVWSSDEARAWALAETLDAGTVWVNTHGELLPTAPFGGAKLSGLGYELGEEGLAEFTQLQVVNMARQNSGPSRQEDKEHGRR